MMAWMRRLRERPALTWVEPWGYHWRLLRIHLQESPGRTIALHTLPYLLMALIILTGPALLRGELSQLNLPLTLTLSGWLGALLMVIGLVEYAAPCKIACYQNHMFVQKGTDYQRYERNTLQHYLFFAKEVAGHRYQLLGIATSTHEIRHFVLPDTLDQAALQQWLEASGATIGHATRD